MSGRKKEEIDAFLTELTERFGGITAYLRSPAVGLWQEGDDSPKRDELIVCEVMTGQLDVEWWNSYRAQLESSFQQESLVIRSHEMQLL